MLAGVDVLWATVAVSVGVLIGAFVVGRAVREVLADGRRQQEEVLQLVRGMIGGLIADRVNVGAPEPSPPIVPPLTVPPPVDPTDAILPDVSTPVRLSDLYPSVDPWLIGEPSLPETIQEAELHPDEPQVMTDDGNWVPLREATRPTEPDGPVS